MPEIYAEWVNRITGAMCRVSFDLKIGMPYRYTEKHFEKNGIRIRDRAISLKTPLRKSAVYADPDTPTHEIIEALREYILKYYTTQEDTLKVEIVL